MLGYRLALKNSSSWKGRAKKLPVVGVFFSQTVFPAQVHPASGERHSCVAREEESQRQSLMRTDQVGAVGTTELQDSLHNLSLALSVLRAVRGMCHAYH